jgi:hypothetical protein
LRYFIVYFTHTNNQVTEYYMKSKSADRLLNRLEWYCGGCIVTNLGFGIMTQNLISIFVREIDPTHFPHLSKRDFAMISENQSYGQADLIDDDYKP